MLEQFRQILITTDLPCHVEIYGRVLSLRDANHELLEQVLMLWEEYARVYEAAYRASILADMLVISLI